MRVVALLRGVNLGPNRRVSMATLRDAVGELGHENVETYLQSGNIVLDHRGGRTAGLEADLGQALTTAAGFEVEVIVRSGPELEQLVALCPYAVDDPTKLVVAFFREPIGMEELGLGELSTYAPDELTLTGRDAYVRLPDGQARSKLMEALTRRKLPTLLTVRNWRTVTALAELTR